MISKHRNVLVLFVLIFCSAGVLRAQGVAAHLNVGTMGPGLGINVGLTEQFNVRATGYLFSFDYNGSFTDESNDVTVDYESELHLGGASALLDWHPGGERLSRDARCLLQQQRR